VGVGLGTDRVPRVVDDPGRDLWLESARDLLLGQRR
jgi:hypothetical protein